MFSLYSKILLGPLVVAASVGALYWYSRRLIYYFERLVIYLFLIVKFKEQVCFCLLNECTEILGDPICLT